KTIVEQSRLKEVQYMFQVYQSSFIDDEIVFSTYEPNSEVMLENLDADDLQIAWRQYKVNGENIFASLVDLTKSVNDQLSSTLKTIEDIQLQYAAIEKNLESLLDVLEKHSAEIAPSLLAHFENSINQRLAKHNKWIGDIQYLEYQKATNKHNDLKMTKDLEYQILNDNLRAKDVGGRQWPR
ncbi:MAG: hypothetical protein NT027_11415, partial [Proteobacteria bacterium]|nr:hypothetical protein [Pseudomonadota bacterium]